MTMSNDFSNGFIEQRIIDAVRRLLVRQVNENLKQIEFALPLIELGNYEGADVVCPVVTLASNERTEKERIIRLDVYSLTIAFSLPPTPESELYCYIYSGAVSRAFYENPTLGGVADRAVITGKKYVPPKRLHNGEGWKIEFALRVTVEEMI